MRHASCLLLPWIYAKPHQPQSLINSIWLEKSFNRSGLPVDERRSGLRCPFMMQFAPKQKLKIWLERKHYRPMYADTFSGVKSLRGDLLILFAVLIWWCQILSREQQRWDVNPPGRGLLAGAEFPPWEALRIPKNDPVCRCTQPPTSKGKPVWGLGSAPHTTSPGANQGRLGTQARSLGL